MSFKPPLGQSCANCYFADHTPGRLADGEQCPATVCCFYGEKDEQPFFRYCGHWRGNARVTCFGCKQWRTETCPRALWMVGRMESVGGPHPCASACERWEDKEGLAAVFGSVA